MMKVMVRLLQYDMQEKTETVIVETGGLLKGDKLSYFEKEGIRHDILFSDEQVVLKRGGQFGSEVTLPKLGRGTGLVHSPYGTMSLETQLLHREKKADRWTVEYQIVGTGGPVSHMKLVWYITMQA